MGDIVWGVVSGGGWGGGGKSHGGSWLPCGDLVRSKWTGKLGRGEWASAGFVRGGGGGEGVGWPVQKGARLQTLSTLRRRVLQGATLAGLYGGQVPRAGPKGTLDRAPCTPILLGGNVWFIR